MKKIILPILFGITLLWGCKKDSIPDPEIDPVSEKFTTIKIVSGPGGSVDPNGETKVKFGEPIVIIFKPDSGYVTSVIEINGINQIISDTIRLTSVIPEYNIRVEFIDQRILFLTEGSWFLQSIKYYDIKDSFLYSLDIKNDSDFNKETFFRLNTYWSIEGNFFYDGGMVRTKNTILELSKEVFVYQRPITQPDGRVEYMRLTFKRTPNPIL